MDFDGADRTIIAGDGAPGILRAAVNHPSSPQTLSYMVCGALSSCDVTYAWPFLFSTGRHVRRRAKYAFSAYKQAFSARKMSRRPQKQKWRAGRKIRFFANLLAFLEASARTQAQNEGPAGPLRKRRLRTPSMLKIGAGSQSPKIGIFSGGLWRKCRGSCLSVQGVDA